MFLLVTSCQVQMDLPVHTAAHWGHDARFNYSADLQGAQDAVEWSYVPSTGGSEVQIYNSYTGQFHLKFIQDVKEGKSFDLLRILCCRSMLP